MNEEALLNELGRVEGALQRLTREWRARQEEGRDATAIESALFAATQKVGVAQQRLQVLYEEARARQIQSPVLPLLEPTIIAMAE